MGEYPRGLGECTSMNHLNEYIVEIGKDHEHNYKFPTKYFYNFKEACSYAMIAAKSTGKIYEVCRDHHTLPVREIMEVDPRDCSLRQEKDMGIPSAFTNREEFLMQMTGSNMVKR